MSVKDCEHGEVKSLNGNILKQVDDFKYQESYMSSSKKDFEIRKAKVWVTSSKLHTIWTSGISTKLKIYLSKTCVEGHTSVWFRGMDYVKIVREAFRWHIHTSVNESTKYQLETTFYTGTNLWKPPKDPKYR